MKTLSLISTLTLTLFLTTKSMAESIYDFKLKSIDGAPVSLSDYKGKVLLVVNTASQCGYTPQYKPLQALYQKYQDQGFVVLGFPSNDFGSQEPGTGAEIKKFCETRYQIKFPLFEKGPVSGDKKQNLYAWLIKNDPSFPNSEVKWNFEKFLVNRSGKVIARFRSGAAPDSDELKRQIEKVISEK